MLDGFQRRELDMVHTAGIVAGFGQDNRPVTDDVFQTVQIADVPQQTLVDLLQLAVLGFDFLDDMQLLAIADIIFRADH